MPSLELVESTEGDASQLYYKSEIHGSQLRMKTQVLIYHLSSKYTLATCFNPNTVHLLGLQKLSGKKRALELGEMMHGYIYPRTGNGDDK